MRKGEGVVNEPRLYELAINELATNKRTVFDLGLPEVAVDKRAVEKAAPLQGGLKETHVGKSAVMELLPNCVSRVEKLSSVQLLLAP